MRIPAGIAEKVKEYYAKYWERQEKFLAQLFLSQQLDNPKWVDLALWEVRKKYGIQGTARRDVQSAAESISQMDLNLAAGDQTTIAQLIEKIASVFYRRELSLTSKFLHFCYPESVPPFDRFAYAALCSQEAGRSRNLRSSHHPRNKIEIENWLKAFREFHKQNRFNFDRVRIEIMHNVIPPQDKSLAEHAITTYKVCDLVLWTWGQLLQQHREFK